MFDFYARFFTIKASLFHGTSENNNLPWDGGRKAWVSARWPYRTF
jgi:hypothetical protein